MSIADTAQRLIRAGGRTVTLVKGNEVPSVNAKPWRGPSTVVSGGSAQRVELKAVFEEKSESELARSLSSLTGSGKDSTRRSRSRFLVSALDLAGLEPSESDFIEDGNIRWRIVGIELIQPGDTKIVYFFEVAL